MRTKFTITLIFLGLMLNNAKAQKGTIATIGNKPISTEEFIWAFNKNNKSDKGRAEAIKEYLDLHINYKLKVQEAFNLKLDTSPEKKLELAQLYSSMAEKYINEENIYSEVVKEAFNRLQTERVVSHIFIAISNFKNVDTVNAKTKIANEALNKLKAKQPFNAIAAQYSEDAGSKNNGGLIGTITALTFPYELENIIYNLKVGSYSNLITSKSGLHIFYVNAERKATGRIYAKQILFANQMHANGGHKVLSANVQKQLEAKPALFDSLVVAFSNDQSSANNKGQIAPFYLGNYDLKFENGLLQKNAKQKFNLFETDLGWHITIVDSIKQFPTVLNATTADSLVNVVKLLDRGRNAKDAYINNMLPKLGYKQNTTVKNDALFKIADNVASNKNIFAGYEKTIDSTTILHSFPKLNVKVADWAMYYKNYAASGATITNKNEVLKAYIIATAREYYVANYADYNTEFKYLMNEFKEGNIYFDFMQNMVWSKASEDEASLKKYYNANKNNYNWKPGVSGIIISASELSIANELNDALKRGVGNINELVLKYEEKARIDSGRFEFENLLLSSAKNLKVNEISKPEKLNADGWFTFIKATKLHNAIEVRSFDDAKGLAANDYQTVLDNNLIEALKKKYPVVVNQQELKAIISK